MACVKTTLQALAAATQSQALGGGNPTKGNRMQQRLAVANTIPRSKSLGADWSFARTFQHACRKALATAAMNTAQVKSIPLADDRRVSVLTAPTRLCALRVVGRRPHLEFCHFCDRAGEVAKLIGRNRIQLRLKIEHSHCEQLLRVVEREVLRQPGAIRKFFDQGKNLLFVLGGHCLPLTNSALAGLSLIQARVLTISPYTLTMPVTAFCTCAAESSPSP